MVPVLGRLIGIPLRQGTKKVHVISTDGRKKPNTDTVKLETEVEVLRKWWRHPCSLEIERIFLRNILMDLLGPFGGVES